MICAYIHPWCEAALHKVDAMSLRARLAARSAIAAGAPAGALTSRAAAGGARRRPLLRARRALRLCTGTPRTVAG